MSLKSVVQEINFTKILTGQRQINFPVKTVSEATEVFQFIDSTLSPENLTCDGELSHTQVMKRQKNLQAALKTLKGAGFRAPSNTFNI